MNNTRFFKARTEYNVNGFQSADDVKKQTGVSRSTIDALESESSTRGVSHFTVRTLAKHYGVSVDYLLGLSDVPTSTPDMKAAAEYTGLSEAAVSLLHALAPSSYEGNNEYTVLMRERMNKVINYCLSDPDFYYYVMEPFGEVLLVLQNSEHVLDSDRLTNEELDFMANMREKGLFFRTAADVLDSDIMKAADRTSQYWNMIRLMDALPDQKEKKKAAVKLFLKTYGIEEEK